MAYKRQKKSDVLVTLETFEIMQDMEADELKTFVGFLYDIATAVNDAGYDMPKDEVEKAVAEAGETVLRRYTAGMKARDKMLFRSEAQSIMARTTNYYENNAAQRENRSRNQSDEKIVTHAAGEQQQLILDWMQRQGKTVTQAQLKIIDAFVKIGGTRESLSTETMNIPNAERPKFDWIGRMKELVEEHNNQRK